MAAEKLSSADIGDVELWGEVEFEGTRFQRVRAVDIEEAIGDLPLVDYMHMDIQGSEYDFLSAKPELLQRRVKMVNIGTHSKAIERNLKRYFKSLGWACRYRVPINGKVRVRLGDGPSQIVEFGDGVQVWENPGLGQGRRAPE